MEHFMFAVKFRCYNMYYNNVNSIPNFVITASEYDVYQAIYNNKASRAAFFPRSKAKLY